MDHAREAANVDSSELAGLLRDIRMVAAVSDVTALVAQANTEKWPAAQFLTTLLKLEIEARKNARRDEPARQPVTADDDVGDKHRPLWELLRRAFNRPVTSGELAAWAAKIDGDLPAKRFVRQIASSSPIKDQKLVQAKFPAGHFFSPVVDPDLVGDYVAMSRAAANDGIPGIEFPLAEMEAFWNRNAEFISTTPFIGTPGPANRYDHGSGPYPIGDAITLRAMIHDARPRRIIEMGSGYSTACMLDSAEHCGLEDFHVTCIEPYPGRLHSVLRPGDIGTRVTLLETTAQSVPLTVFSELEPNDILFIDSTHVLKTGSDVHYQLYFLLPRLPKGVLIHIHDCRWPLEYSDKQIFEKNYSWNEVYGVRALLMYSERFKVAFSGSYFAEQRERLIRETSPLFMRNPGSALWLRVV